MLEENTEEPGTFSIFFAEGESLAKQGEYPKAIESFTKALEHQPGEKSCLVARSKCYLLLGDASAALQDAEDSLKEDKRYHRGLYQKAEALYQTGDFEYALVNYHRGFKLRPELNEFKLGIQKAQEAIQNSIGTPDQCRLELVGDLSHFTKQAEMAKKKKQTKKIVRPLGTQTAAQQKPKERKPIASDKTVKELLGELYADRQYLEGLLNDKNLALGRSDNAVDGRIHSELQYLDGRVEFWRQQKPMYARKREKELKKVKPEPTQPIGMSLRAQSGPSNHARYVLKSLEEIDATLSCGEAERSLDKARSVLRTVEGLAEGDLPGKVQFVATLHSCIGNAQMELGQSEDALEHHLKDHAISRELGNEEGVARAQENLVKVYMQMGEYQEALEHLKERSLLAASNEESVWVYHEMGKCYLELEEFDLAKEVGEKATNLASEVKDMAWYLNSSVLVARAEVKLGDLTSAVQSFERSLEIAKIVHDEFAEVAIKKALDDVNQKIVDDLKPKEEVVREDEEQTTMDEPKPVEEGADEPKPTEEGVDDEPDGDPVDGDNITAET